MGICFQSRRLTDQVTRFGRSRRTVSAGCFCHNHVLMNGRISPMRCTATQPISVGPSLVERVSLFYWSTSNSHFPYTACFKEINSCIEVSQSVVLIQQQDRHILSIFDFASFHRATSNSTVLQGLPILTISATATWFASPASCI